jgi:hypothetical protein
MPPGRGCGRAGAVHTIRGWDAAEVRASKCEKDEIRNYVDNHAHEEVVHLEKAASELAPFDKLLFSTDGYALPELYLVGAARYQNSFAKLVGGWVADGAMSMREAERVAVLVGSGNARRVYQLALLSDSDDREDISAVSTSHSDPTTE